MLADFVRARRLAVHAARHPRRGSRELAAIPDARAIAARGRRPLAGLERYEIEPIEAAVRALPEELGVKPKAVFAALRLGMSGQSVTPGLFESLWALGRNEAVGRLAAAAAML